MTKEFKHQTDILDLQDLEATWQVVQVAIANICRFVKTSKNHTDVWPFAGSSTGCTCVLQLRTRVWCQPASQTHSGTSAANASPACLQASLAMVYSNIHSSRTRYMQVVPLPLADDPAVIPSPLTQMMDRALRDSQLHEGAIASVHDLPYQNYFSKLSSR